MSGIKGIDIESNIAHIDHVNPGDEIERVELTEEDVWHPSMLFAVLQT